MDELMRWLDEQLAEDERIARAARDAEFCKDGRWAAKGPFGEGLGGIHSEAGEAVLGEEESVPFAIADHAARHDPARVLREIDAKRQIVDLHGIVYREIGWLEDGAEMYDEIPVCGLCVPRHSHYQRREDVPEGACATSRLLALPYADRPDFREEWRP